MKIAIVEPRSVAYNIFSHARLPLLGPIYLATILKNKGHDVSVINENMTPAMENGRFTREIEESDILLMSGITATIPRGYDLCREFRRQFPNKRIIIGGSHVSFVPEEALKYADVVVVGEAEEVIEEALTTRKRILRGSPVENLDKLPFPDFRLVKDFRSTATPIITSRGCPFACKFCSVTKMFGRSYRFRSADNVLDELRIRDTSDVFFYDDNFTANQARSKELLRKIKDEDLVKQWDAQVRVDVVQDPELLSLMTETNCTTTYIGFESVNEKTLKLYNKGQTLKDIRHSMRTLHDNGIAVHGMFVLGSDKDDRGTIKRTADFCDEHEIDTTQFLILTPIPGTEMYYELDQANRIFTKDWKWYDGLHVVFRPKLMSPMELQVEMMDAMKHFYSFSRGFKQAIKDGIRCNLRSLQNWLLMKKSRLPNWKSSFYKMLGSSVIKRWEAKNTHYMEELARITERLKRYVPERPRISLPTPRFRTYK